MTAYGQSELLAKNYFEQGKYEKALSLYDKLYRKDPNRLNYLTALVETHQQLEQFTEAEALLQKKIGERRIVPQLFVELGHNYALQNRDTLATESYLKAIDFVDVNPNYAYPIGSAFLKYSLLDEAVITYEKAMTIDPEKNFNQQLARIYGEQGDLDKMFGTYIDLIQSNPSYTSRAQRDFSSFISEDPLNEANVVLRKNLLRKSQESPDVLYNQLLSWLFIQQKEFKKAFTQEKAIYKRDEEQDLDRLVNLGLIAISEEAYDEATDIIEFYVEEASSPSVQLQGQQYLMKIALATATEKEYPVIEKRYESLISEFGDGRSTYLLQIDYNHFLAFQAGKSQLAITNLKKLTKEQLNAYQEAKVKMELADILVFDEKFNQALIYYSQIQNKVKSDVLAQEARFKVARTSYYKGDFEWSQIQLDVLRKSASQLIANDAMQLSLIIRDNSLEDSTQTALRKFARADLLALQNKDKEAITALEEILTNHKGEKIEDEALLKQGELYEKREQFVQAEANYNKLIELYPDDILADDAHFRLAKLYEVHLDMPIKAKELYEQIIFNFADSIYFVEARKRFRMLRGDAIN